MTLGEMTDANKVRIDNIDIRIQIQCNPEIQIQILDYVLLRLYVLADGLHSPSTVYLFLFCI